MSGRIQSPGKTPAKKISLKTVTEKFVESPQRDSSAPGVYESTPPPSQNRHIETMLADIVSRLDRIEEKIDENIYPPESAIKPEFIRQVKKAEADIRKGKGKAYESMDDFIRAISE